MTNISRIFVRASLLLIVILILLALGFVAFVPSPINAKAWSAPTALPLEVDRLLANRELVSALPDGPEDITFDAQGRLYTGDEAGNIYQITLQQGEPAEAIVYANTGGRPNGLAFDASGTLFVADLQRGLLRVDVDGSITVLADEAGGEPLGLANELAVAADGTIYFSDTSTFEGNSFLELLEGRPYGRLLRYQPQTGQVDVLLENLYFANGVVLSPDEDFVLVAESYRYQITRYWLEGENAGTVDLFVENLPGFPDNLSRDSDGNYWVALFAPRVAFIDQIHAQPFLANQLAKLPEGLLNMMSTPPRYGLVAQLDAAGHLLHTLHDPQGDVFGVTTAVVQDGYLYLGTPANGSNDVVRYVVNTN